MNAYNCLFSLGQVLPFMGCFGFMLFSCVALTMFLCVVGVSWEHTEQVCAAKKRGIKRTVHCVGVHI